MGTQAPHNLPNDFRKLSVRQRRELLAERKIIREKDDPGNGCGDDMLDLADVMVETAIGVLPVPLGAATGFIIDGKPRIIPMATEEPSVIAAASYGAKIISLGGGLETSIDDPVMTAQIFLEGASQATIEQLCGSCTNPDEPAVGTPELAALEAELLPKLNKKSGPLQEMTKRGGGFRSCDAVFLPETGLLRIQLHIDVRDAMGANILNTAAEYSRPLIERRYGCSSLMAILTNDARQRKASARFSVPVQALKRRNISRLELANKIVLASKLAQEDPSRAVTHNKGIMNGISALALATGNDTRGLEAAVHRYAARDGQYRGLSTYRIEDDNLIGELTVPMPLGTVGGAIGFHPGSQMALRLLGTSEAEQLGRIAAALGLAQNLAAVSALVAEGIQHGHMRYHANRLAFQAGARGPEIAKTAAAVTFTGVYNLDTAKQAVHYIRVNAPGNGDSQT